MAGNPNPSPETRFQPGQSGNPGGKTAEHVAAERKAAEISALMRLQVLSSMQEKINAGADPMELLTSDAIRLFKDSEDRAHGTPKATTEMTGANGGPVAVINPEKLSPTAIRELLQAMDDQSPDTDDG